MRNVLLRFETGAALMLQIGACWFPARVDGQQVFFDRGCPSIRDKAITIPRPLFTPEFSEELGRQFVRQLGPDVKVARLTMASDTLSLARTLFKDHRNPSYEGTIGEIKELGLPDTPVARVLMVNGAALFSYRSMDKYRERLLTGKTNPIILGEKEPRFELLHFVLNEPGPALQPSDYSLVVFTKSSSGISFSSCAAVTQAIWNLTKVFALRVEFRPDVFFLTANDFPVIFPFRLSTEFPSKADFALSASASCSITSHTPLRCSGSGFQP